MSEKELESIVVTTEEVNNSTFDYQSFIFGYPSFEDAMRETEDKESSQSVHDEAITIFYDHGTE